MIKLQQVLVHMYMYPCPDMFAVEMTFVLKFHLFQQQ